MSFARPEFWPWLLAAPALALLLAAMQRGRLRRLARALGPRRATLAGAARPWRILLFPVAALLGILALVQPQWGEGGAAGARLAMDLVVCLDVSRSMLAEDVEPSRLARAREELRALAERAAGDRLALVAFAGDARLVVPLTRDLSSLARMADLQDPLTVARGGSDLGAAIDTAAAALGGRGTDGGGAILLLTDGEDLEERGRRAAERARAAGIDVHCLGFGSPLGAKIPDGDAFLRDDAGAEVVSRMDPDRLRRLAGGAFAANGSAADYYERRIRTNFLARAPGGRANRYQWPLLAAVLLWAFEAWWRR